MTGIIETDLRYEFLKMHSKTCNALELYNYYEYFYKNGNCPQGTSYSGDCIWYLKKLLAYYRPEESIPKLHPYRVPGYIEDFYILLMGEVADMLWQCDDFIGAIIWAKKALDMIDYFHPHYNAPTKQKFIKENHYYSFVAEIFERYKDYLDEDLCRECEFDWEKKFYSPATHANQNFKYRIGF